jgi:cytochrome c-type biogenesis protein CcmH
MSRGLLLALLLLGTIGVAQAQEAAVDAALETRYQMFVTELRCLVCQNQTIADSNAPLAKDLRDQVRSQLQAGRSDEEIRDYVTARYGDFVLYRPPFKPSTWVLWLAPFALLLLGVTTAVVVARRRAVKAPVPAADRQRLNQLLDEER